jgi:hypothetical protein
MEFPTYGALLLEGQPTTSAPTQIFSERSNFKGARRVPQFRIRESYQARGGLRGRHEPVWAAMKGTTVIMIVATYWQLLACLDRSLGTIAVV